MQVLSIQSLVSYGHVGNSAAMFPLQRLGHEVWPVPTVVFSNHTGYGAWRGPALLPDQVHEIVLGLEDRGVLADVDLVLSGYLGSPGIVDVVHDAVDRVRKANPDAAYSCDPVMGNATSGCFVDDEIPPLIRERMVPAADIVTPNQFELGFLTGALAETPTTADLVAAAHSLRATGPAAVLVTSAVPAGRPDDELSMLAVDDIGAWQVTTPRLPMKANGSGDVAAALFAAHLRGGLPTPDALGRTAASAFELLETTHAAGSRELLLIEAQTAYVEPRRTFEVHPIG